MEKGKVKIKKNGSAELIKGNKQTVNVPEIFILSNYIPAEGSNTIDCEYELDSKSSLVKLSIEGKLIDFDHSIQEKRVQAEQQKLAIAEEEARRKVEDEANKSLKDSLKNDFIKIDKIFLPSDTGSVLKDNEYHIKNFSLKFNKMARYEETDSKFKFYQLETKKNSEVVPGYKIEPVFDEHLFTTLPKQDLISASSLFGTRDINWSRLIVKPDWRMSVGLGVESVYETSIALHHLYGIPYIPSSSIKGVVRSWIITEYFGNPDKLDFPEHEKLFPMVNAEYRAYTESEMFCKIFGCPKDFKEVIFENKKPKYKKDKDGKETTKYDKKDAKGVALKNKQGESTEHIGQITFFDAFPTEKPTIEPDIMNPHYPEYYGGEKPPTDYQNPVPIFFLTVKDTAFQFIIGSKKEPLDNYVIGDKTIVEWLKDALENHGIGAKTAVGYGYMKES